MKLSKAQAFLLSRIANGEIIQRNGQGKFDTWYSTDIHGLHVNYETAKILLSCGAVEEREIRESKFYRRFQLVIPNNIDYAADSGDFDTASRITPDPAGEDMTADDGRPVDVLRTAHTYRAVMARLYGTYSDKAQRAAAVFENLFAVRNVKFA